MKMDGHLKKTLKTNEKQLTIQCKPMDIKMKTIASKQADSIEIYVFRGCAKAAQLIFIASRALLPGGLRKGLRNRCIDQNAYLYT